ncbi:MAG: YhcH/YjgK/YiaL family protein [Chitinophagaceae bacterium]
MNRYINGLLSSIIIFGLACSPVKQAASVENWPEDQINSWFNKKEWMAGVKLFPDSSIDRKEFAIQYHRNKERYDRAFSFLKNNSLNDLTPGDHELDGRNVYVKVSAYNSKDPDQTLFETHQKYTDIHLVLSGMEYIGSADFSETSEKTSYDKNSDIQFYHAKNSKMHVAAPGTFFLFFPGELHRPGVRVEKSIPVKKIVIKIINTNDPGKDDVKTNARR